MKYVIDSSALLAFIREEPGADKVEGVLDDCRISAVNYLECARKMIEKNPQERTILENLNALDLDVVSYSFEQSLVAADMVLAVKGKNISLGDLASLSLARHLRLPAITADKAWAKLKLGVEIIVIR